MSNQFDRRRFFQTSAAVLAAGRLLRMPAETSAGELTGRIKKALGYTMIQEQLSAEDKLRLVRDLGFEGVEVPTSLLKRKLPEPKVLARASEKTGTRIHGVVNSSHPDLKAAVDEAVLYGADSVLHVVRAAPPDGSLLEHYRQTQQLLRQAADYAERKKVYILVENVWATFLIEPLTMARYIDEIGSPYVQAYFDIGNVVRWGWPQHWIEVLGRRIVKVHVKEFSLNVAMNEGMRKAFAVPLGQGSIDWPLVRRQLRKIDYRGWATAEVRGGNRQQLAELSEQMDRVLDL